MPEKNTASVGLQSYDIIARDLKDNYGSLRSLQNFLLVSYGVTDWFSIDLKGGAGYIKAHPTDSAEIDYGTNFAGGYGVRFRVFEKDKLKSVFGFQHISVHPDKRGTDAGTNRAILDDWQVSLLASYDLSVITPYVGTRWSRVDYIHKVDDDRKRKMSDLDNAIGLIAGCDIPWGEKFWVNLEGQFIDAKAFAVSFNYSF
ncbi:MAG: hypothetical protein ABH865_03070 [Candidatus Omnitrophota bacterium]